MALAALTCVGVEAGARVPQIPSWPVKQYDPKPVPDTEKALELHLPMPCGGSMVFRRIDVASGQGLLGEREIELGGTHAQNTPDEQPRRSYLSAPFGGSSEVPPDRHHFYLGKYEVTELQYQVLKGPCPEKLRGRRPALEISWFDAVDFTRRYTEWLHHNAGYQLPRVDGVRGFLRLPTEVEWEYAARGGMEVDAQAFRQALFPMPDESVESYAWIRESVASSFEARPIGSLLPNPLGLHDILGNAAELVQDLYRLNVHGRMHGQAGGFLIRGGHFRSWRKGLGTSWRREHPHFNPSTGAANRLDTVGFRIAISAPVLTSARRINALRDEYERLPVPVTGSPTDSRCHDLALEVRDSLSSVQTDLELCLVMTGFLTLSPFPQLSPSPAEAPARLPAWDQLRKILPGLATEEVRQYGLWFLRAKEPDRALVLLKQAARRGDGWSALAIGALYDPALFESPDFEPQQTPFTKPNPDMATCWYQVAQTLGEKRATVRLDFLLARLSESRRDPGQAPGPASASCEQVLRQYGKRSTLR